MCFGYSDGTANITTNGGTMPYSTDWFGQNNNALTSGNYSALVTDNNGCTNTLNFNISEPSAISIVIDSFKTSCFGYSDGSAILTISGGFPPFIENWFGQNPFSSLMRELIILKLQMQTIVFNLALQLFMNLMQLLLTK